MFEKTFSLWRRLVKTSPETAASTAVAPTNDDRRLWERYVADLSAQVQLAHVEGSERFDARVQDLSLGGVNLQLPIPFESGQLLTLSLPTQADEVRTVLACVVRAQPEGEGRWSVGCTFSRELTVDDLQAFGARRLDPGTMEQRRWERHPSTLSAQFQLVGETESSPQTAQVLNISASGIGLQVSQPVDAGSLLSVDLIGRDQQLVRSILACVVHTTARTNGEVAVGCNFIRELAEDELRLLL